MRIGLRPVRDPLLGSASSGQPAVLGQHPRRRPRVVTGDHDRARARRQRDRAPRWSARWCGTSGTSARCVGLVAIGFGDQRLVELAVEVDRAVRGPGRRRGRRVGRRRCRSAKLAASPKSRTWSVVWLAPVPRSRAGRSAVSATRGTPAWAASSTAGCRFAAAVRDVVTTAAGRREPLAMPEREEAGGALVDPGVQRDPVVGARARRRAGRCATRGRARRRSARARRAGRPARSRGQASVGGVVTSDDPAARPRPRPSAAPVRRPLRRRRPPASRRRRPAGRRTGKAPSTGAAGRRPRRRSAAARSRARRRSGSSGRAAARATPAAMPMLGLDRAGDDDRQADVLGDPQAGAHAAQRLHLEHRDVGGLEVAHPVGVGSPGGSTRRRRSARRPGGARRRGPRPRRHGCSTYSSPPAARSSTPIAATASSTDQAPLASIRTSPSGPSASRTASSRASSSRGSWPGSATLTFAVRQPPRGQHDLARLLRRARRDGHVDRDRVAHRRRASRRRPPRGRSPARARRWRRRTPGTG